MSSISEDVKREIGQHFVFGFHGYDLDENIVKLIRDYHLGNVILFKRNIQSIAQARELTGKLQQLAKESGHDLPLLIGIDQENGLCSAFSTPNEEAGTQLPGAMALAASGSVELTQQIYAASGKELRAAGINWAYSPVADVNSDPRNPVIGVRSFGDDPAQVAKFASAASRGLQSERVIPCAKHFPGHGDTHVDSHLALPRITRSREQLDKTELVPFRALVEQTAIPTIMTGHMAMPTLTGNDTPCSLSPACTELLRGALGFEEVIVTDCLEMDAVAEGYGSEKGAVMALKAGADVVMICHRMDRQSGAVEAAYEAVAQGELDTEKLRQSGERIRKLKEKWCGSWQEVLGSSLTVPAGMKEAHTELSKRAYAASVALVQDPHDVLPLSAEKMWRVLLVTPQMERINPAVDDPESVVRNPDGTQRNTAGPSYLAFAASVVSRVDTVHVVCSAGPSENMLDHVRWNEISAVLFALRNADRARWQIERLQQVLHAVEQNKKDVSVVLVSTCAPYDLLDAVKDLETGEGDNGLPYPYIATFEFTKPALEAAAAVIFGEAKAAGTVPVLGGKVC